MEKSNPQPDYRLTTQTDRDPVIYAQARILINGSQEADRTFRRCSEHCRCDDKPCSCEDHCSRLL